MWARDAVANSRRQALLAEAKRRGLLAKLLERARPAEPAPVHRHSLELDIPAPTVNVAAPSVSVAAPNVDVDLSALRDVLAAMLAALERQVAAYAEQTAALVRAQDANAAALRLLAEAIMNQSPPSVTVDVSTVAAAIERVLSRPQQAPEVTVQPAAVQIPAARGWKIDVDKNGMPTGITPK